MCGPVAIKRPPDFNFFAIIVVARNGSEEGLREGMSECVRQVYEGGLEIV